MKRSTALQRHAAKLVPLWMRSHTNRAGRLTHATASMAVGFALAAMPCLGQLPAGPPTLENLLQANDATQPDTSSKSPAPTASGTADPPTPSDRPKSTFTRPKDGVQHPDLDAAWAEYDASVKTATEALKAAVSKQFEAAIEVGDLEAAEKWDRIMVALVSEGLIPTEPRLKQAASLAQSTFTQAADALQARYTMLIDKLTKEALVHKQLDAPRAVREEWRKIDAARVTPPNEWASIFDGTNRGWGDKVDVREGTLHIASKEKVKFRYGKYFSGDMVFEAQVMFSDHSGQAPLAMMTMCANAKGNYTFQSDGSGVGWLGTYRAETKQWIPKQCPCPAFRQDVWQTWQLQKKNGTLSFFVNGKHVVSVDIPPDLLLDGTVQLGVQNADVKFKGMRVKLLR